MLYYLNWLNWFDNYLGIWILYLFGSFSLHDWSNNHLLDLFNLFHSFYFGNCNLRFYLHYHFRWFHLWCCCLLNLRRIILLHNQGLRLLLDLFNLRLLNGRLHLGLECRFGGLLYSFNRRLSLNYCFRLLWFLLYYYSCCCLRSLDLLNLFLNDSWRYLRYRRWFSLLGLLLLDLSGWRLFLLCLSCW